MPNPWVISEADAAARDEQVASDFIRAVRRVYVPEITEEHLALRLAALGYRKPEMRRFMGMMEERDA